jgi:hypothetical protein
MLRDILEARQSRTLRYRILAALGFVAVTAVTVAGGLALTDPPEPADQLVSSTPAPRGTPQHLMRSHDCWTMTEGPPDDMAGELPGHVIVLEPGATTATYSERLVGPALEQLALDHPELGWEPAVEHHLTVIGFCR